MLCSQLQKIKFCISRGQRSVESLSSFIMEQLKDPVTRASNMDDLETLDVRIFTYTFTDFPYTFFYW